jgi:hypothetical protein
MSWHKVMDWKWTVLGFFGPALLLPPIPYWVFVTMTRSARIITFFSLSDVMTIDLFSLQAKVVYPVEWATPLEFFALQYLWAFGSPP